MKTTSKKFYYSESRLLDLIQKLHKFGDHLNEKLDEIAKNIETGSFTLAFVGQFKRGKTTLINAILGQRLLPSGVLPLTSVITIIRYGPKQRFFVVFQDGKQTEIKKEEIEEYVTEKLNPKNIKNVKRVEIETPSHFLKHGVVIVDTPGIGSVYQHNSDVAYRFLPDADAVVFVLSADPPISDAECEFLEESSKYASKFFFVLNKVDYLNKSEIRELYEFNKRVVASKMGVKTSKIRLFPLSAKNALESKLDDKKRTSKDAGMLDFEKALEEFIVSKKREFVLASAAAKIRRIVEELINERLIEKSNLEVSSRELEERCEKFEVELQRVLSQRDYNNELIDIEQKKILEIIDADLAELKQTVSESLVKEIVAYADSLENKDNKEFAILVDNYRQEKIRNMMEAWRNKEEEKIAAIFSERMKKYSNNINNIISEVEKIASGLFGVKIVSKKAEERLTLESAFYFKLSKVDETKILSLFDTLLPKSIFKKLLLSRLPNDVREDIDRNCGRIRYDFLERMQKSALRFKQTLNEKIEAAIEGIRSANERAKKIKAMGVEKTATRLSEIEHELRELRSILNLLNKLRVLNDESL
jgi:GTPase Era involved in 16S rRNA processing